jgi:glycosyltransferase involved in cell wall biosynthesis
VESVLAQEGDNFSFEIIVVNDSGEALPEAAWMADPRVRVLHTLRRERSVARNTGAACARGTYLHFLDDDDWLLPGAMLAFWELTHQFPSATWLYGATQLVDRENNPLIQLRHRLQGNCFAQIMAGEWIPLQASLIPAEVFFELRGFLPGLSSTQDVDLCRRAALMGDFAETEIVVACVGMGETNSTTQRAKYLGYARWAREQILNLPGVFARLRGSARGGEWLGRVARLYGTSVVWNLQHRKLFTALSRGCYGLVSFLLGAPFFFSGKFWQAIRKPYASVTFVRGFEQNRSTGPG